MWRHIEQKTLGTLRIFQTTFQCNVAKKNPPPTEKGWGKGVSWVIRGWKEAPMHCNAAGVHLSWKVWKEANVKGKDKLVKCKTSLHTPQHVASYCLCNISGHDSIWTLGHSETGSRKNNCILTIFRKLRAVTIQITFGVFLNNMFLHWTIFETLRCGKV